ncbi:hypothetical protein ABF176_002544 [Flavobacterium psychrophilum]
MKKKLLLLISVISLSINAQENPTDYSKNFNSELKTWKETFTNLNLKEFEEVEKTNFKDLYSEDKSITKLGNEYKKIGTYSPNKSKLINIYSYLNLEKKGETYIANYDVDQNIELYLVNENKKITLFSGGSSSGIDEVFWVSENKLLLVGTTFEETQKPMILIVDFNSKTITRFHNTNNNCKQKKKFKSEKLNKLKIKGI